MAVINLANLTIPTPQPYDKKEPQQQMENLCYVLLQLFVLGKAAGVVLDDQRLLAITTAINGISLTGGSAADLTTVNAQLTALVEAVNDLTFTGEKIEIPALGLKLIKSGKVISIIH
jgi:hypothetical protein